MKLRKRLLESGYNYTTIANYFEITPQAVSFWEEKGVPAKRVIPLSKLTGINASELRPDLYPKSEKA